MDGNEHARLPLVTEICADEAEVLALAVTRFIAAGYMTQDVACWDAGHRCAEEVLGLLEGPRLVAAMAAVMRALRAERSSDWRFMPATCCRITADESSLIQALQHARRGSALRFASAVRGLTHRADAPSASAALQGAAQVIETVAAALESTSPSSRRQVLHS